jgi:hypothetical protein
VALTSYPQPLSQLVFFSRVKILVWSRSALDRLLRILAGGFLSDSFIIYAPHRFLFWFFLMHKKGTPLFWLVLVGTVLLDNTSLLFWLVDYAYQLSICFTGS